MKPVSPNMMRLLLALGAALLGASYTAAATVDFEDLAPDTPYAGPGGGHYWNGPDLTGTPEPDPWGGSLPVWVGSFPSGGVGFVNRHNENYGSWSGFAYSNTTDATTAGYTNQYSAYTGSGVAGSPNYGVGFGYLDSLDPSDPAQLEQLPYLELPDGASVQNAHVTNTTYAAISMRDGNGFAKKFGGTSGDDPDWFLLTAYGADAAGTPLSQSVELYLADYRFSNTADDYIVDQWAPLDLSPLADAKRVYFNLSSSDTGTWGMNTPAYFAIDNLEFGAASTGMVPEPSTCAIWAAFAAAWTLAAGRRRRRVRLR